MNFCIASTPGPSSFWHLPAISHSGVMMIQDIVGSHVTIFHSRTHQPTTAGTEKSFLRRLSSVTNRMYQPKRAARSEFVRIRTLDYHVLVWGEPAVGKAPIVMAHGWMDVAASWQFVVDALACDHWVIAPDGRGYGLTESPGSDYFWFLDYLADLDFLLDHYSPCLSVNLVGHSMGGLIAMLYAGSRPDRIRRLVNLEGFGLAATRPSMAPRRYAKWMDQLKAFHRGEMELKAYDSLASVAQRLSKVNGRLTQDKADWLAAHWARPDEQGRWRIVGDAAHKIINPQLFRKDEVLEIYRCIAAPTLAIEGCDNSLSQWWQDRYTLAEYHDRLKSVPDCRIAKVCDAGHMLHHDQPEQVAELIDAFVA
ncbi:alpha/beta hydrolase [Bradyrhizobium arachidis]|uniref:alpha/beta fold hydrolase n=1 Tax=Bradyrhizobium arachidis TaxID=858423 RepID=UPI0021611B27|nr:alpha/beta hydrolase [Bradyrhizobium arachidis]UVO35772.1 alpha/beta hydrolase [Bradyrhizobium arachidis]